MQPSCWPSRMSMPVGQTLTQALQSMQSPGAAWTPAPPAVTGVVRPGTGRKGEVPPVFSPAARTSTVACAAAARRRVPLPRGSPRQSR